MENNISKLLILMRMLISNFSSFLTMKCMHAFKELFLKIWVSYCSYDLFFNFSN